MLSLPLHSALSPLLNAQAAQIPNANCQGTEPGQQNSQGLTL